MREHLDVSYDVVSHVEVLDLARTEHVETGFNNTGLSRTSHVKDV